MALKYYYDLMSQPCRALYIFLKMNNIPFEGIQVALRNGENRQDWYTKLNPFQRVPTIDDGGFVLTESIAILRYLSEKHNIPDHWFPRKDIVKQARHDEYLHWQHWNIRLNGSMVFQHLVVIPRATRSTVDRKQVEKFSKATKSSVNHIDSYFLNGKNYLCGEKISVADLLGLCELQQLNACCMEKLYEDNENVRQWVKRVIANIGPLYEESHVIVHRVRDMVQKMNAADQPKL
ncbi:hypothetical protein FSP39_008224 [Pinctada imbricata]|uniref:Glutathione S-transferase theta-1 n=1 Tax=Pinctada imbricata TaxID=66713 RepID=A0AA88XEV6_PINIB|nr:hypothetical protein FSP39_008224 [Pinctada imbricata]